MSRRRRNRQPRTIQDFVRAGVLRPVQPTTSSGHTNYGQGREMLAAAHADNTSGVISALAFGSGSYLANQDATIACRLAPKWAGNDSASHTTIVTLTCSSGYVRLGKASDNKWYHTVNDGTSIAAASAAVSFAANTTHYLVARHSITGPAGTVDINTDGTNGVQQTNVDKTLTVTGFTLGAMDVFIGPVIISPERKSDTWTTALQADTAAWSSPVRLIREYMDANDLILPLNGDSSAYMKTAGSGLPFDEDGLIVCDGNSLTLGSGQTSYPTQLAALMYPHWVVKNYGVNAQTTPDMTTDGVTQLDPLAGTTYYPEHVCVAWEIRNDISENEASVEDALANFWTYCDARQAAGWKVVVVNVLPAYDTLGATRIAINAGIAASWADHADALADVAGNSTIGDDGDQTNTTYYTDGLHLTSAGYAIVAGIVKTAIDSIT